MQITIQEHHLKIASSLSTNIAAGFLFTIPTINDPLVLTGNMLSVIVFIQIALKAEALLKIYD